MISCPEAVESLLWLTVTVWDENISVEENWSGNVYFWWKVWLHPNKKALIYGNVAFFCIWFWTHTLHTYIQPQVWSCAHFWSGFTYDFTLQIHMHVNEVFILSGQCPDNLKGPRQKNFIYEFTEIFVMKPILKEIHSLTV